MEGTVVVIAVVTTLFFTVTLVSRPSYKGFSKQQEGELDHATRSRDVTWRRDWSLSPSLCSVWGSQVTLPVSRREASTVS